MKIVKKETPTKSEGCIIKVKCFICSLVALPTPLTHLFPAAAWLFYHPALS
jgi:hypothetical protein